MSTAIDAAIAELAPVVGTAAACRAVGRPRQSHYRHHPVSPRPERPAPKPHKDRVQPRALSQAEKAHVVAVLNSEQHADAAPATVYAKLLDEGTYLCSTSTMYRILRERGEVGDRRGQRTHPTPRPAPAASVAAWQLPAPGDRTRASRTRLR